MAKSQALMQVVIMEPSAEQVEEAVHLSCQHQAASQAQSTKPISQYLFQGQEALPVFLGMVHLHSIISDYMVVRYISLFR